LSKGSDLRWFVCTFDEEIRQLSAGGTTTVTPNGGTATTIAAPAPLTSVTVITLDSDINDPSRKSTGGADWVQSDASGIVVPFGLQTAAVAIMPAFTTLESGDALQVPLPIEEPADGSTASVFQLEDKNNLPSSRERHCAPRQFRISTKPFRTKPLRSRLSKVGSPRFTVQTRINPFW
jgi:hypothetical protein